jgi:tetratricopeptide (TPR) repeat protein
MASAGMSKNPSASSAANEAAAPGACFVVMGFGKKTDFETGRVLDLNQSYQNLIKPAVEAAGLKCIRADEIVHSGLIDLPMYELLLKADVVVADLSTSNRNAIYELGVRHALRPYTTVIIAEEQMMNSPLFDLSHIVIRKYKHLGEDIGVSEAKRFTTELTTAINEITALEPKLRWDSPVYKFIDRLTPPSISEEVKQAVAPATASAPSPAISDGQPAAAGMAHSEMMRQVDEAQKNNNWGKARTLLEVIRDMRKSQASEAGADADSISLEDPYILQRLALATYKSQQPNPQEALKAARDLLNLLQPQVSNDTETLGLWGAVHKRWWDLSKESVHLDQAIRGYERGFYLRNDYYNGINYAFLLNVRAARANDLAESVADFIQARRVRSEVLEICEKWLEENPTKPADKLSASRYWVLATIAEAHLGLEDESLGRQKLEEAFAAAPEEWMKHSTREQVDKLQALMATSPLKKLPASI